MHETIRIIRNTLFRAFLIGIVVAVLYAGTYYGWRGYWDKLVVERWGLIDERSLTALVIGFFLLIRLYLVFGLLVPALALHWTLKRLER